MLFEVSATPKPGLVDRNNSGAHGDMDYYTFMASSAALGHTFFQCAEAGLNFEQEDYTALLDIIRPIGLEGEKRMFQATGGINTHKGLIFSLGLIATAVGTMGLENFNKGISPDHICSRVVEMTKGLSERELGDISNKDKLTYGEKLYRKYGIKGIRGEVESGFISVRERGFPILKKLMEEKGGDMNDILVQVLLYLMTTTEDSNILGRHDLDTLQYVQKSSRRALELGGIFSAEGRKKILQMDEAFIQKNISPGGSADLLAVTLMLYFIEKPKNL